MRNWHGNLSPFGDWHTGRVGQFSPRLLFARGEQGAWFDPDPTTCFTDTAGTTPAQVGDAVALMLDKSKGLVLGPELVTNGTFDTDTTGWTNNGTPVVSVSDGIVSVTQAGSSAGIIQNFALATGQTAQITLRARRTGSGTPNAFTGVWGTGSNDLTTNRVVQTLTTTFQEYTFHVVGAGSVGRIYISPQVENITIEVDFVSAKILPGNHTTQSVTAARPILARVPASGRRNILTNTDSLSTQTVTVRAVEHVLSFFGTGTVTLSGASTAGPLVGTGENDRVHIAFTPTAGSLTLTVSGSVNYAQLEKV
jgi:hypothetical protein